MYARTGLRFFKVASNSFTTTIRHKITLINSDDQRFMAVISIPAELNTEAKLKIKKQLIDKGFLCIDYLGDPNKIAVGFDKNNFIHAMEEAIKNAENDSSPKPKKGK